MTTSDLNSVVFVITSLGFYGAEAQVVALAESLAQRGWEVGIVSLLAPERPTTDLAARGIRVLSLGMTRSVPDPRAIFRLRSILRRWHPDVVHSHMVHANLLTRVTRLFTRMPILVSTGHNFNEGGTWRYVAYRATDFLADATTNVSQTAVAEATRRGAARRGRIQFIPNGIDTSLFAEIPGARAAIRHEMGLDDQFVWLAVGRLVPAKDYPTMIRAFVAVRERNPNVVLLIAGTGPRDGELTETIERLGLQGSVRLLGLRKDVAALMQAADGYVMSSSWEGLPIALLEASSSGLPIVASDVGGNAEVVVDGRSGFIVPPHDPAALAERMLRILELDPEERAAMGDEGRRFVAEQYALTNVVDDWERLYAGLRSGRSSTRH